jgi:hypothetical protein
MRTLIFSTTTDPLVHHGRHFGRTVHALCRVHTLLANGILYEGDQSDEPLTKEYDDLVSCHSILYLAFQAK